MKHTLNHKGKPPALAAPVKTAEDDEQLKFNYFPHDDDDVAENAPSSFSAFPPLALSIGAGFEVLTTEMGTLDLCAPCVEEKDLTQPDGLDIRSKQRNLAILSCKARGHTFHDPEDLINQGYPEDDAKRIQYCYDEIEKLGYETFLVKLDLHNKKFQGLFCKSCDKELGTVRNCVVRNIPDVLRTHSATDCNGTCPSCEMSAATLHMEYQVDRYLVYKNLHLCTGETPVEFDTFIDAAEKYQSTLGSTGAIVYYTQARLFNRHTQSRKNINGSFCERWYQDYALFREYVHHYKHDTVKPKEAEALFPDEESPHARLKEFRRKHYALRDDGTYGGKDRRHVDNFFGCRNQLIRALHNFLEHEEKKGKKQKKLSWVKRVKDDRSNGAK